MKSTGIIRKVDELGRIVLPIELRRTLDIEVRDEMEIFIDDGKIVLQKFEPTCTFCGASPGLMTFRGKNICSECVENLSRR
jgi:transcriptional pleiotropic regulator of transition state genes